MDFIHAIEQEIGKKAQINYLPLQIGDVPVSFASATELEEAVGYKPATSVAYGMKQFLNWFRDYYKL